MYSFEMLPEVVRSWPSLVCGATVLDGTSIEYGFRVCIGMTTPHVAIQVVGSAKTDGARTACDWALKRLLVPLPVFSTQRRSVESLRRQDGHKTYLSSDLVLTLFLQYEQMRPLLLGFAWDCMPITESERL